VARPATGTSRSSARHAPLLPELELAPGPGNSASPDPPGAAACLALRVAAWSASRKPAVFPAHRQWGRYPARMWRFARTAARQSARQDRVGARSGPVGLPQPAPGWQQQAILAVAIHSVRVTRPGFVQYPVRAMAGAGSATQWW